MGNRSKRELIVSTWRRLGTTRVGAKELRAIQDELKRSEEGNVMSPASVARVLADEGAELKHPEIIEFDASWRASQIENEAGKFKGVTRLLSGGRLKLAEAEALINELERLREGFESDGDREALPELIRVAADARRAAQSNAKDRSSSNEIRAEQSEIATWFKVWIQTPNLFADWVDLRKHSTEFQQQFAGKRI